MFAKSNIEVIVDIIRNNEIVKETVDDEEGKTIIKEVNAKEALNSFENMKSFIEKIDFYNENTCYLLSQIEILIHDIEPSERS